VAGESDADALEAHAVALLGVDVTLGDEIAEDVLERLGLALCRLATADDADVADLVQVEDERRPARRVG
jgi:hypothetical protein